MRRLISIAGISMALASVIFSTACGGGGGSSSSTVSSGSVTTTPPAPSIVITSPRVLPGALTQHAYSATLQATGGTGALHWSIAPADPPFVAINGLAIDANTGTLSGFANFLGIGGFRATVTDSASQKATQVFTLEASGPLMPGPDQAIPITLFQGVFSLNLQLQGGVGPISSSVTGGTLPPGLHMNPLTGNVTGTPYEMGTFTATVTTADAFSPPEIVSQKVTYNVLPAALQLNGRAPFTFPISFEVPFGRSFSTKLVGSGGTPPYTYSVQGNSFSALGTLPPGLTLDPLTGLIAGTSNALGSYSPFCVVTDSTVPTPQRVSLPCIINISPQKTRNDTPATATPVGNEGAMQASISPYVDPPSVPGSPFAADHDYYRILAAAGSIVHVETFAKRGLNVTPLDTVIEINDVNGVRVNTCRQPGDTSNSFTSTCLNDDISSSPHVQDSALDLQVPPSPAKSTYVVHVFDWAGNARPDMFYDLHVSGVMEPLTISATGVRNATRTQPYNVQVSSINVAASSWTISSGALPPGLSISSNGFITGTPTTDGTYSFVIEVVGVDGQIATTPLLTVTVSEPVAITSAATLPDACLNKPYSFTVTATGGTAPLSFSQNDPPLAGLNLDQFLGIFKGTPVSLGTFSQQLSVTDAANNVSTQTGTLRVVTSSPPCP